MKSLGEQLTEQDAMSKIAPAPFVDASEVKIQSLRTKFKQNLLQHYKVCHITGISFGLVASHIKPLASCLSESECTHWTNGLLLSKNIDYLFDKGYISFTPDGELINSKQYSNYELSLAMPAEWLTGKRKLVMPQSKKNLVRMQSYLNHHREHVFRSKWCQFKNRLISKNEYENWRNRGSYISPLDDFNITVAERISYLKEGASKKDNMSKLYKKTLMETYEILKHHRKMQRKSGVAYVDETTEKWRDVCMRKYNI